MRARSHDAREKGRARDAPLRELQSWTDLLPRTDRRAAHRTHVALVRSIKSGKVVAIGTNANVSVDRFMSLSVHAEVNAIDKFFHRIARHRIAQKDCRKGFELISLRINADGNLLCSKPCLNCSARFHQHPQTFRTITYVDETLRVQRIKNEAFQTTHVCKAARSMGSINIVGCVSKFRTLNYA